MGLYGHLAAESPNRKVFQAGAAPAPVSSEGLAPSPSLSWPLPVVSGQALPHLRLKPH